MSDIVEISRSPARETLLRGDPWTFILDEADAFRCRQVGLAAGDVFVRKLAGDKVWRRFEVVVAHGPTTYETRYRDEYDSAEIPAEPPSEARDAPASPIMTQGEMARAQGYTGDACSQCGQFRMKQSGHCLVCDSCGTTTGCS